jgi:flagellar hook-associated protein 3 FlgL
MRISTGMIYQMGIARIGEAQSALARTQQQVATGRRIVTPADDPVGAAGAVNVAATDAQNSQYAANRALARSALALEDGTLAGVTELIQNVKATVIAAGNPTLGNAERGFMAADLKGQLQQLIGLANSVDANGDHLFAGFQSQTPPYVANTATGADYQGDANARALQVSVGRQLPVADPGTAVFGSLFQDLNTLINVLSTPVVDAPSAAALNSGLATAGGALDAGLDRVLTVRAAVGSRLAELDALDSVGSDLHTQFQRTLSELQDTDYNQAISTLSQQQTTLEAAQKSYVKVMGLSLFNFL